ncbi:MAG: hypothetical protein PVJ64_15005 [Gemmatimonadales bacterium]
MADRSAGYGHESLRLVLDALRLSAHVVRRDPTQLAGQLTSRLLTADDPTVTRLRQQAHDWQAGVWVRLLVPTVEQAGGPLVRTLEGHTDSVHAVALTPDGRRAISGSGGGYPGTGPTLWAFPELLEIVQ